jgi:hypothetical protein
MPVWFDERHEYVPPIEKQCDKTRRQLATRNILRDECKTVCPFSN